MHRLWTRYRGAKFIKVYVFINTTLAIDTLTFGLSVNTSFEIFEDDSTSIFTDSLFNHEDTDFFRLQFALLVKVEWEPSRINGPNESPEQDIKTVLKEKKG